MDSKIIPSLWFYTNDGRVSQVIQYYKNIFGNNFQEGKIIPLGETPSGNTELCEVQIFGQKYSFMSTAQKHHSFNDSVSFTLNCSDQKEIDKYWDYFTQDGEESQCGWCIDKFGLRWQVIPANLAELMSKPNSWQVMMKQKKIIINEY
ncbi:MAG: VOC family protein [Bacteroidetes bacterium]|nr:VOC family protein [Bacteroidota bacterium]